MACFNGQCENVKMQVACDEKCRWVFCNNKGYLDTDTLGKFIIHHDADKGRCLFTTKKIQAGDFIIQYTGKIVPTYKSHLEEWNRLK